MNFIDRLTDAWKTSNSLLCVGLDPDVQKIPSFLREVEFPLFEFNRRIIDATSDLVCAYKPQIAYYAASGAERDLELTIEYIQKTAPGVVVILDAKRGDIGSTAEMYAKEAFDRYGADAVTVNPYMGGDTLTPFTSRRERGVVLLCRTSNPGAGDLQDLQVDGESLYRRVARNACGVWKENGNIALVIGATYPEELAEIRTIAPRLPFLVPGIGAQGGSVEKAVTNGQTPDGTGLIINSSRGIIYAGGDEEFAEAARDAATLLRDDINQYRA